jgi:hypothetical protein
VVLEDNLARLLVVELADLEQLGTSDSLLFTQT